MATTASITITGDSADAVRAIRSLERSMSRATREVESNEKATARAVPTQMRAATAFKATASALTAFALTNRIRSVVQDVVGLASRFVELSAATGISVPILQLFSRVLQEDGVSADQANKSIQRLFIRIGEARRGVARPLETLQALGLTFEEINELSPDRLFFRVANALSSLGTEYQLATFSADLFGARNIQAGTTIARYGDQLEVAFNRQRAFGLVTAENAADLKDLGQTLTDVGNRIEAALGNAIAMFSSQIGQLSDTISQKFADGITFAADLLSRFGGGAEDTARDLNVMRGVLVALAGPSLARALGSLLGRLYNGIRRLLSLRSAAIAGVVIALDQGISFLVGQSAETADAVESAARDQINASESLRELFEGEVTNLQDIATRLQITQQDIQDIRREALLAAGRDTSFGAFQSDFEERFGREFRDFGLLDFLQRSVDAFYDRLGSGLGVNIAEATEIFIQEIVGRLERSNFLEEYFSTIPPSLPLQFSERERLRSLSLVLEGNERITRESLDRIRRIAQEEEASIQRVSDTRISAERRVLNFRLQVLEESESAAFSDSNLLAEAAAPVLRLQRQLQRSAEESLEAADAEIRLLQEEFDLLNSVGRERDSILATSAAIEVVENRRREIADQIRNVDQEILDAQREYRSLVEEVANVESALIQQRQQDATGEVEGLLTEEDLQSAQQEVEAQANSLRLLNLRRDAYNDLLSRVNINNLSAQDLIDRLTEINTQTRELAESQEVPARRLAIQRALIDAEQTSADLVDRINTSRTNALNSIFEETRAIQLRTEALGLNDDQIAELNARERARIETNRLILELDQAVAEAVEQKARAERDFQLASQSGVESELRTSALALNNARRQLELIRQFEEGTLTRAQLQERLYQAILQSEQATVDFARAQEAQAASQEIVNQRFENFRQIVQTVQQSLVQLFQAAIDEGERFSDVLRDISRNLGELLLNQALQGATQQLFPQLIAGAPAAAIGGSAASGAIAAGSPSSASSTIQVFVSPGVSPEQVGQAVRDAMPEARRVTVNEVATQILTPNSEIRQALETV